MFDTDLGAFFAEGDGALRCTRERPGEDDAVFPAWLSVADESRFSGQLVAGVHQLHFATAAAGIDEGDIVRAQRLQADGTYSEPEAWRVLRTPERLADGAQSRAFLTPAPDA